MTCETGGKKEAQGPPFQSLLNLTLPDHVRPIALVITSLNILLKVSFLPKNKVHLSVNFFFSFSADSVSDF